MLATGPEAPLVKTSARFTGSFNSTEPIGDRTLEVCSNGTICFNGVVYSLTTRLFRQGTISWDPVPRRSPSSPRKARSLRNSAGPH